MSHLLSQREAARAWGLSRATLQRAIKAGKVSVTRAGDGSVGIDPSEMQRAFGPPVSRPSGPLEATPEPPREDLQAELARARTDLERAATEIAWRDRLLEERGRRLETLERLLLAPPERAARPPGFWRRIFGG